MPLNIPGAFWRVLGGHKFKSLLKLSNGWTHWHQIWHTCADSSGNGYTPNKLPIETRGGHLGVLGGQTLKSLEKLSNGWTDWHQLWFTSVDSSGNGHSLNTSRPTIPQGAFWGFSGCHKFKCLGSCQTARPIGTKFGTCLRIRLGMDIAKYNSPLNTTGGISGGFRGHKLSGKAAKRMDRLAPNSVHACGFIWEWA